MRGGVIVGSPWQDGAGGCIASFCLIVTTSELFAIVVLDDGSCIWVVIVSLLYRLELNQL